MAWPNRVYGGTREVKLVVKNVCHQICAFMERHVANFILIGWKRSPWYRKDMLLT